MFKKKVPAKLPEALRQAIDRYISQHLEGIRLCAPSAAFPRSYMTRPHTSQVKEVSTDKSLSLEDMLKQADAGFTETLLKKIDSTGKKDAEIYKRANLSKQHFSKIRNNPEYRPTKATAIALALALELSLEETRDLIGRAGYALNNNNKFDLIVRYHIENRIYDVVQVNMALFDFDQPLLGA